MCGTAQAAVCITLSPAKGPLLDAALNNRFHSPVLIDRISGIDSSKLRKARQAPTPPAKLSRCGRTHCGYMSAAPPEKRVQLQLRKACNLQWGLRTKCFGSWCMYVHISTDVFGELSTEIFMSSAGREPYVRSTNAGKVWLGEHGEAGG